jgi:hypothetical protein
LIPFEVRKIPQLDTLADAVDRCLEMGRPCFFYIDYADFSSKQAPEALASIGLLSHVASETATKGISLLAQPRKGEMYPHYVETVREAYMAAGKIDDFTSEMVRYNSDDSIANIAANYSFLKEEQPAAILGMGGVYDSIYYYTGYAALHGIDNISIAGSGPVSSVAYIVIGADEWLIGDEYYAAAIAVGGKEEGAGSLITADFFKFFMIALLIIGVIAGALGVSTVIDALLT